MSSGHFIFQIWSTIPITTQVVTESKRYHSRNQEHNPGHFERSQHIDRAVIESHMTRTINSNPEIYKIPRRDI